MHFWFPCRLSLLRYCPRQVPESLKGHHHHHHHHHTSRSLLRYCPMQVPEGLKGHHHLHHHTTPVGPCYSTVPGRCQKNIFIVNFKWRFLLSLTTQVSSRCRVSTVIKIRWFSLIHSTEEMKKALVTGYIGVLQREKRARQTRDIKPQTDRPCVVSPQQT